MSLEDISKIIDEKMDNGNGKIVFTFYEVNLKYNFSKEDKQKFLRLAETKLENLGYKCYFEKQQYEYMGGVHNLEPNEVMVAIRKNL